MNINCDVVLGWSLMISGAIVRWIYEVATAPRIEIFFVSVPIFNDETYRLFGFIKHDISYTNFLNLPLVDHRIYYAISLTNKILALISNFRR